MPRILKEITTYEGNDSFKKFREILVQEVSENFEILEYELQGIEQLLNEIIGEEE